MVGGELLSLIGVTAETRENRPRNEDTVNGKLTRACGQDRLMDGWQGWVIHRVDQVDLVEETVDGTVADILIRIQHNNQ